MILQTDRLLLQVLDEKTFYKYKKELIELDADEDVRLFHPNGVSTEESTIQRMKEFINFYEKHQVPAFVVLNKSQTQFYGRCGFSILLNGEVEVGYLLHKEFWGQGYGTEVLNALLVWAKKNFSYPYVIGYAPIEHIASQRVMEKCGMGHYKTEKDALYGALCKFYRYFLNKK